MLFSISAGISVSHVSSSQKRFSLGQHYDIDSKWISEGAEATKDVL